MASTTPSKTSQYIPELSFLPLHILARIASFLHGEHGRSLLNLALTCKSIKTAVQIVLWRHVWYENALQEEFRMIDLRKLGTGRYVSVAAFDHHKNTGLPQDEICVDLIAQFCRNVKTIIHVQIPGKEGGALLFDIIYKKPNTATSIFTPFIPRITRLLDTHAGSNILLHLKTTHFHTALIFDDAKAPPPKVSMIQLFRLIEFDQPTESPFRRVEILRIERPMVEARVKEGIMSAEFAETLVRNLPEVKELSVDLWFKGNVGEILTAQLGQFDVIKNTKVKSLFLNIYTPESNLAPLVAPTFKLVLQAFHLQLAKAFGDVSSLRCGLNPLDQCHLTVYGCSDPYVHDRKVNSQIELRGMAGPAPGYVGCASDNLRRGIFDMNVRKEGVAVGGFGSIRLGVDSSVQEGQVLAVPFS